MRDATGCQMKRRGLEEEASGKSWWEGLGRGRSARLWLGRRRAAGGANRLIGLAHGKVAVAIAVVALGWEKK